MSIRKTIKKWAAYNRTVRELNALGNRELTDLGITRRDIDRIARDHASAIYFRKNFEDLQSSKLRRHPMRMPFLFADMPRQGRNY